MSPHSLPAQPATDLWVFGYGSLMWNPGFRWADRRPANLRGWHRSFCLWSVYYRGTPEHPGVVLGLDHGGSCRGIAFRVEADHAAATLEYLRERELVGYAYEERWLPVRLDDGQAVSAYTFVADRDHAHYAGRMDLFRLASTIMDAEGVAGLNRDYLINTLRRLEDDGFMDRSLHRLLAEVERLTGLIDRGAGI